MLEKNYLWRIYWRLAGGIMVCVVVALAVASYFSHRVSDRELVPETEQKAATVGASGRAVVLKATSYGIDFSQLYGVEQTFAEVFEENQEFAYMAITNTDGNVLFARGTEPTGFCDQHPMRGIMTKLAGFLGGRDEPPAPPHVEDTGLAPTATATTGTRTDAGDVPPSAPQKKRGFWSRIFGRDRDPEPSVDLPPVKKKGG